MDLFVYTDESGTFDKVHNQYYTYGGMILLGKDHKDDCSRKYIAVERTIRENSRDRKGELKACNLSNEKKGKLFRSLNQYIKFGVVIDQSRIHNRIFDQKKSKQRYLDYAYKIGLKRCLEDMIKRGVIRPNDIRDINVFVDEHSTATNGKYELKEGLESELMLGTFNSTYSIHYPPILPNMNCVNLQYCNSEYVTLIRAADIISNKMYHHAVTKSIKQLKKKVHITYLP